MARIIRRKVATVHVDVDHSYVACAGDDDEEPGCVYFNVEERKYGWYLSAMVDSGHSVDDIVRTDGPYKTEADAIMAGKNAASGWLYDNYPGKKIEWDTELLRRFPEGISGGLGALFGRR